MSYASDALIDTLERENARLREELEAAKHDLQVFSRGAVELNAENAKLRELCEDMLDCIEIRASWHRPPTEEMYEGFAQQARELGIDGA